MSVAVMDLGRRAARAVRPHGAWLMVLALCGAAAVVRWPDPQRYLEYDEVISILFAREGFGRIVEATAADTMPPLYYWLLHLWSPSGDDLFRARLLSTVLGVAAVPVVYLLGRMLLEPRDGLLGAALMALSPFPAFYGHYARMYALLALLGLAGALFFIRWLREGRPRDLAIATAALALSLYVHNLAAVLVLALDLLFLIALRRGLPGARLWPLALAHGAMLLAYLPWLLYLPGQLEKVSRAFWIPPPGPAELVRTAVLFLFHLPLPGALLGIAAFVALVALAVTVLETRRWWRAGGPAGVRGPEPVEGRRPEPAGGRPPEPVEGRPPEPVEGRRPEPVEGLLALAILAVAPVVMIFLVSQVRPVYVERAMMAPAAAYYLLLAAALRRLPVRPLAWGLWGALGLVMAAGHGYQSAYESFPRSPYYAAADYLRQETAPDDLVLHDNKLSYFPTYFFARELPQSYLPDPPGSANDTLAAGTIAVLGLPPATLDSAVTGRRRVWFVVYRRALEEDAAAGRPPGNKSRMDQRYRSELVKEIGDLQIYLYHVGSL